MFNLDATTSQHNIGLAVALAFEHLKRGDGQQHYILLGQSQPEVGTTKLTQSIITLYVIVINSRYFKPIGSTITLYAI